MSAIYSLAAIIWGGSLLGIAAIGIASGVSPHRRRQFWGDEERPTDQPPLRVIVRES